MIVFLIAIFGIFISIKRNIQEDRQPLQDLNESIIKLNSNFEHMLESDEIRDKRITKHGEQIDELKEKQRINEKVLDRHELIIGNINERLKGGN